LTGRNPSVSLAAPFATMLVDPYRFAVIAKSKKKTELGWLPTVPIPGEKFANCGSCARLARTLCKWPPS